MLTMQIKLQEITGSVLFFGYFGLEFIRNYLQKNLFQANPYFQTFIFAVSIKDEKKQREKIINELVVC